MIATKDRPAELGLTLREMLKQSYQSVEVVVVDDGSASPVEPIVRRVWPDAVVVRHETSAGQCARRNQGFALARGKYVLQLDDDCSFVASSDLERAVAQMEGTPDAGAWTCYIVNAPTLPPRVENSSRRAGCVASFMGAVVLMRKKSFDQTEGYRSFFGNEWEEEELGLQLLRSGWKIIFAPEIVAHHRLSPMNRNSARKWMQALRNRIWALMIHMPFPRIVPEVSWKIMVGVWDAIRLARLRLFAMALWEAATGAHRPLRTRRPLSPLALRRYDALRLHPVLSHEEFDSPPAITWKLVIEYARRWTNRARNRSVWDRKGPDVGRSYVVAYAHDQPVGPEEPTAEKHSGEL